MSDVKILKPPRLFRWIDTMKRKRRLILVGWSRWHPNFAGLSTYCELSNVSSKVPLWAITAKPEASAGRVWAPGAFSCGAGSVHF